MFRRMAASLFARCKVTDKYYNSVCLVFVLRCCCPALGTFTTVSRFFHSFLLYVARKNDVSLSVAGIWLVI